jgi:uncharacterized protein with PIN domain
MPDEKPPLRDDTKERRCTVCDERHTLQYHVDWEPHRVDGDLYFREVWECQQCGSRYFDGRDQKAE